MRLVDTSIWIDFLRGGDHALATALNQSEVYIHPYIIGELALGNMNNRDEIVSLLNGLPKAIIASQAEIIAFIDAHSIYGKGIGYVDTAVLLSAILTPGCRLWTRDKKLERVATTLPLHMTIYG
ncbi:type II toxin-antitoxin system VapC family toxin [Robiginitomaculum antarcticum]|uniref:type II toxin-antitoxin system VapC family toxin n=1 Tax=Robiginitomaculum antarcticum TaxID=437507 RepID=UPI0003764996|nr:PIN domain-containing protein [Robiginitomaculum antarcticum]